MISADKALHKLKEGNRRFVGVTSTRGVLETHLDHIRVVREQKPFAIILGCSDSRVPAELVFHCGLGELFVIRVAGNLVAPSQIGSIEYACQQFDTELVVVMGHSNCGAIRVTVDALLAEDRPVSPNLKSIVERIAPAVAPAVSNHSDASHDELIGIAVNANIQHSVRRLSEKSMILRNLVEAGRLKIVGAEYSLDTGEVVFLDD
ncbi:MAG TPA: carbonic anhydrase [Gammaproteobacteria bacterium]|nr:carbonic anhydrase [Gammaproteobacteria bacterium]